MKISYIADTSLTNKSAYTYNVVKHCDAFAARANKVSLLLPFLYQKISTKKIRKIFLLTSKKNFSIKYLLPFKTKNFIARLIFGYISAIYLRKNKSDIIITRCYASRIFLSLFNISHYLEIHAELVGLTKFLMINMNYINSKYILNLIFITNALRKKFPMINKNKHLILPDAVDVKNFRIKKNSRNKIKTATYIGSFHKGKGVELILQIAKNFQNIRFNIYGNPLNKFSDLPKNVKIHGYIDYNKIPSALSQADILLLPSANVQFGRDENINIANYNSPCKMFYYLAAGKIILSSKRDGICEILKNDHNSIIVSKYNQRFWVNELRNILNNKYDLNKLRKNSIKTAKKYTFDKRINNFLKNNESLIG